MKFRDFVVNSLPRVRGKKKARPVNPSPDTPSEHRHESRAGQPSRLSSVSSRESSVERASHVAVADASWRQTPPRTLHDEVALVGAMAYYAPPPGMVMSHSAEGISSHSLAILPSRYPPSDYGPYSHMSAISENAVNYAMPRGFMFQSQHHHRHNHQHDHHYVYHHHHHHQYPSDPSSRAPLAESNRQHLPNHCKTTIAPRKSEPGFLRKSFASFKAMRKQRSNGKEQVSVTKPKAGDENGKCSVCPYPQLHVISTDPKKPMDTRPAKPKRKGLKSLRKSKQNHEDQMDKTWFSDNDACTASSHHASDADLFYHTTTARPRFRECSVESCMSRLYGSQEGTYGPEAEYRALDSNSLSGYESDLPKTKSGRTRSRIKTNPWLPSPQPSLNIGRRFAQCDFQESHEDVMTVDEDLPTMPRSASFEHQRPTTLSSFQTSSKGKSIQRHRSLTPSDLKITLSVRKSQLENQPSSSELSTHSLKSCSENNHLNDLNVTVPKLRPSSILSPASEFVILADNIEQLANNISFEYEDMLDTTLESVSTCQEDGKISIQELLTDEELSGNCENKEIVYSDTNHDTENAHSPDSGIGCLGSSDGDELAIASAHSNEQSSLSSSNTCVTTPSESCPEFTSKEESKSCHISDLSDTSPNDNSSINWLEPQVDICNQSARCYFATHSSMTTSPFSHPLSNAVSSLSDLPSSSNTCLVNENTPVCGDTNVENTESSGKGILKEEAFDNVPETHAKEDVTKSRDRLINSLDTFSKSLADDQYPSSTFFDKCLCSENMNNFQEKGITCDSSKTQVQSQESESVIWPPNIIRSEFVTPVESPTENWQCDDSFLLQFHNPGSEQKDRETPQDCIQMEGRNDEKSETMSTRSETNDKTQFDVKSVAHRSAETLNEKAVDRTDNTTETNCIDWADASVQTDFNEEEFESWPAGNSNPLDDLCDEEFDPIESTRRWLLTGNMQGSADTGYSSQPRDSQILMEDDDSIGNDNLNMSKMNLPKCQIDETVSPILLDSTTMKEDQDVPPGEKDCVNGKVETKQQKRPDDKQKAQSDDLVNIMFSGIESQFQDIFNQLWPAQVLPEISENKRDSSGSSTSTLISESVGGVSIQELMPYEQCGFDAETPRNSGCANAPVPKIDVKKHQNVMQKTAPKKIKTTYPLEPDYVNVPRKGRLNKSNGGHGHRTTEAGTKEYSVSFKKCSVRNYPYTEDQANLCGPGISWSNSNAPSKSKPNSGSTERADYLEFLRDAPLSNIQNKRPMFLLPGFGPIDMSSMANNDWAIVPERQGYANSKQYIGTSDFDSLAMRKSQSRNVESNGGAKPKFSHKKEYRDNTYSSSTDKRHSFEQEIPRTGEKVLPEKPKRKNPRAIQIQPCPIRTDWKYSQHSSQRDQTDFRQAGTSGHAQKTTLHHTRPHKDSSTRSIAERVRQLQREKDIIYSQLREVQQEELSRQRLQLQHQRNIHSQRKDILLETLRELKENLEEQSRQLSLKCNKDVYI